MSTRLEERETPLTRGLLGALIVIHLSLTWLTATLLARAPRAADIMLPVHPSLLDAFGAMRPTMFEDGQSWRLITTALLHVNFLQLALNGLGLWIVGRFIERLFGARALAACLAAGAFAASGAAAAIGQLAVGFSGAMLAGVGFIATGLRGPAIDPLAARSIRIRVVVVMALQVALDVGLNRFYAASGVAIAHSVAGHMAGFFAGLVMGVLTEPPMVRWEGTRGAGSRALAQALIGGAAIFIGFGAWGIAGDVGGRSGASLRERMIAGETLKPVSVPDLHFEAKIPATWDRWEKQGMATFGPHPGTPAFRVIAHDPAGGFGAPVGGPDVLVDTLRREIEARGGRELAAAPFAKVTVDGRTGTRVELRYLDRGYDVQEIWIIVRGRRRVYWLAFLGLDRDAEVYAQRILETVRFTER